MRGTVDAGCNLVTFVSVRHCAVFTFDFPHSCVGVWDPKWRGRKILLRVALRVVTYGGGARKWRGGSYFFAYTIDGTKWNRIG